VSAATLFAVCVGDGLPEPAIDARWHPTRRWEWDLSWPEYKVALEVQGGLYTGGKHVRVAGYLNDVAKLNEGQLLGWLVLWCVPRQLDDGTALALIRAALKARGWEGT
jgi:hypothetical protein